MKTIVRPLYPKIQRCIPKLLTRRLVIIVVIYGMMILLWSVVAVKCMGLSMGSNKLNRQRQADIAFVQEHMLSEERLRVQAQYEDEKFLRLIGKGIIRRDK